MNQNRTLSSVASLCLLLVFGIAAYGAENLIVLPVWPDGPPDENGLSCPKTGGGEDAPCIDNITQATPAVLRQGDGRGTERFWTEPDTYTDRSSLMTFSSGSVSFSL